MTSPLRDPQGYSTITIEGVRWIGTVEWSKQAESPRKWDQVAGQGTTGATVKYNGDGLAEFGLPFLCWRQEHFDFFEGSLRPLLRRPREKEKPKALLVEHPELAKLEVARCVVTLVGAVRAVRDDLWGYPVSFLQHRPPKPVQTLKAKGDGGTGKDDPAKPLDPKDQKIAELRARNAAEAAK